MRPAGHYRYADTLQLADYQFARVAYRSGGGPAGDFAISEFVASLKFVCERAESAAKDYADRGTNRGPRFEVLFSFGNHRNIPAMHADIKFAMDPAATARSPSRARSDFRV